MPRAGPQRTLCSHHGLKAGLVRVILNSPLAVVRHSVAAGAMTLKRMDPALEVLYREWMAASQRADETLAWAEVEAKPGGQLPLSVVAQIACQVTEVEERLRALADASQR